MIEKIIRADEQGEEIQGQELTSPECARARADLPRV